MTCPRLRIASLLASLLAACGDSGTGSASASASSTGVGSTSTASTSTTTATTTAETTSDIPTGTGTATGTATGTTATSDTPTTTAVDPTTGPLTATTTEADTTTTTTSTTTDTTTDPGTSSTGNASMPPPPPDMLGGCQTCDCCDPWPISWGAVPGATEYVVRWKCSINPEQVKMVGNVTKIADVCNDIDMCNGMCAFTVGYIKVEACNDDGCSAAVNIPADLIPITCGGGCCC